MTPRLPLEIWGVVCEQLADENFREPGEPTGVLVGNNAAARQTLLTLCEVSKGLARVAQPVLFRTYDFGEGRNDGKKHVRFLRSILDNPRLAASVRAVMLDHWVHDLDKDEQAAMYGRIADRLGFDTGAFPLDELEEDGPHGLPQRVPTIILLLLPLLPNLTHLTVTTRHEEHALEILDRLHRTGAIQPFASVVQLGLSHGDTELGFDMLTNAPLLALTPNVTTMRLVQCRGVGSDEADDESQAAAQRKLQQCMPRGVRNLSLDYCNLEHADLRALLAYCPRLERFSYSSGGALVDDASREVSNRRLVVALAPAKATLRRVELDFTNANREPDDDDDDDDQDDDQDELTQESFADFPVLQKVTYGGEVIFRSQRRLGGDDKDPGGDEDESE
ncbi:F-box-like domain-containing protein [Apiospora aurea]|uniref:F-box-like domain-containing protein n=1 Tax=Apiospora aurea TaxID=335848 RepID=A0ABR1QWW7_9PEZI